MSRGRALGPGSLKKRHGAWILDWADATGTRRRQSLGPNKADAERRRAEMVRARDLALDGLGGIVGLDLPLNEIVPDYLEDLRPRVTREHFNNVSGKLTVILDELGEVRVRDLKPMMLVRIRSRLTASGLSNRTANLYADNVRSALTWAAEAGLISVNPVQHMKRLPTSGNHQVYRRRALSEEEIAGFLEAAAADDYDRDTVAADVRIPQSPLFRMLLGTGARYREAVLSNWGDIDLSRQLLVLRAENTKSRKQRVVPLAADLIATLRSLAVLHESRFGRIASSNRPIFLSPSGVEWPSHTANLMRIFDRVLRRAGLAKVDTEGRKLDIHALRHTFGTRLQRFGASLSKAQQLMGHSDPKLTAAIYTHLGAEDLRDAIDAMPPLGGRTAADSKEAAS